MYQFVTSAVLLLIVLAGNLLAWAGFSGQSVFAIDAKFTTLLGSALAVGGPFMWFAYRADRAPTANEQSDGQALRDHHPQHQRRPAAVQN